jgi:hypothetical protein
MKDAKPILYANDAVAEAVTTYSETHSLALPQWLLDYHAEVSKNNSNSNLMISTFQARALVWLARLMDAKRGIYSFVHLPPTKLLGFHVSTTLTRSFIYVLRG